MEDKLTTKQAIFLMRHCGFKAVDLNGMSKKYAWEIINKYLDKTPKHVNKVTRFGVGNQITD